VPSGRLRGQEDRLDVDGEDPAEIPHGGLFQWPASEDAGVVDQDAQPPQLVHGLLNRPRRGGRVGVVGMDDDGAAALVVDVCATSAAWAAPLA
jgi:hypothetical protein